MKDKLLKDYPWLFKKTKFRVETGKRKQYTVELNPTIEDKGTFWLVTREKDASPLILSKDY